MTVELFENKAEGYFVIKDGDVVLRLTAEQFDKMKKDGRSPLLKKLWDQAKLERAQMEKSNDN